MDRSGELDPELGVVESRMGSGEEMKAVWSDEVQ